MRILVIARSYPSGEHQNWVQEQIDELRLRGHEVDTLAHPRGGVIGYIQYLLKTQRIFHRKDFAQYDLVHAHHGPGGTLATLQSKVPVVVTYHGGDINFMPRVYSQRSLEQADAHIFVTQQMADRTDVEEYDIIPCGFDHRIFTPGSKEASRAHLNWDAHAPIIAFAGRFSVLRKNVALAQPAADLAGVELKELRGYSREDVAHVFRAADGLVLTSHSEGSPVVIREALAVGCPVVSVDVADTPITLSGIPGCYIVERTPESVAAGIRKVVEAGGRLDFSTYNRMNHSLKRTVDRMETVFERVLDQKDHVAT
ncbi:MAG: glycosyltransferase family 4 protein [Bacteroidota bacterium]